MASRPHLHAEPDPMPALRRRLAQEFGSSISPGAIDRAAADALSDLEAARVRQYVPILAWRHARARLRRRVALPG